MSLFWVEDSSVRVVTECYVLPVYRTFTVNMPVTANISFHVCSTFKAWLMLISVLCISSISRYELLERMHLFMSIVGLFVFQ